MLSVGGIATGIPKVEATATAIQSIPLSNAHVVSLYSVWCLFDQG